MRKVTGKKYFNAIYNYEQLVGHSYGSGVYRPTGVSENQRLESLFTLYYNPTTTTSDTDSFFEDMWYGFSHIDDSWNLFHKKRIQTNLTASENELADINDNIEKLKGVLEYIDNINEYKKLGDESYELMNKITSGNYEEEKDSLISRVNDIDKLEKTLYDKILKLLEYYKTEGKTSDMLVNLFFDPDQADMSASEIAWTAGLKSYKSGFFDVLGSLSETVDNVGSLWKAGEYGLSNLFHKAGVNFGTHPEGQFTRDFIRQTDPNNRITDKWFKDHLLSLDVDKLQKNVESWWKHYHELKSEVEADVKDYLADLQNGTWYFDPKSISPEFERKQESREYGILGFLNPANLPYSFSELGSSFGSFQNMFYNIAADAAIRKVATIVATKFNPYVGLATTLADANKVKEYVDAAYKAQQFSKNVHYIGGAVSTGASLYFTNQMRRWESNAEGMDAYSSRVLNESMNRGVNLNKVYNNIDDYLSTIGISTEGLTDINKILLALAYNAPSGDDTFESIKKLSRKGLARLINENNALAFMDYIEILPFMNYTKSFLRGFGNRGYRRPFRNPFRAATAEPLPINLRNNQFAQEWINGSKALTDAVDPSIRAFVDHQVDKALKKYIKNPKNQLRLSHGSRFFTKKAAALIPLYEKERIEEGQQHLLQLRYGRGEYDDYNKSVSMFDLPSLINTAGLAADAVAGYWGINFGDPENGDEELLRAMDIGGMTALWFRAPHVLTNLASNKLNEKLSKYTAGILGDELHENVRNLFAQFKADKAVSKIVGDSYGKMEDDEHIGIFFDSITKAKVDINKLHESLDDFKKFKGFGVTDDFIERDEQLLNATWNIYNSPITDAFLEYKGIKKDSEEHKKDIQLAVRNIMDSQSSNQIASEDAQAYKEQYTAFEEKALRLLNADQVESTVNNDDKKLYDIVLNIKRTFEESKDARIEAFNRWSKTESAKKDAIQSLLERGVEPADEIFEPVDNRLEVVDRLYSQLQISDEISRIGQERFELELSLEDAVSRIILNVVQYETFKSADQITKLFKNQSEFIKLVNAEFGKDILADQLLGMIHYMNYKLSSARDIVKQNKEIQNAVRAASLLDGEQLLEITDEEILNPYLIELPKELKDSIINSLVNGSINTVLNAAANAYITGRADPNFLRITQRRPSWKQLTQDLKNNYTNSYKEWFKKEEVSENEVSAAYNKERRDYYREMDSLRKEYTDLKLSKKEDELTKKRIEEIEKQAANMFMETQLITKIDRLKIAHDEYLNNRPITYDDLSSAEEGNLQAIQKIENTPREEQPKEEKEDAPIQDKSSKNKQENLENLNHVETPGLPLTMSDDEKYLRELFGLDDESPYLPGVKEDEKYEPGISREETDRYSELNENIPAETSEDMAIPASSEQLDGAYTGADKSKTKQYSVSKDEIEFNYVDQTFFFNNTAEEPPLLKINGKDVKLLDGATLHSGKELATKLLEDGWFYKTKKYYIITGDTETERTEDLLTVCMIIQDGKTAYATFLKRPFENDNKVSWSKNKTTLSEKLRYQNVPSQYLGASEEAIALRNAAYKKALEAIYRRENPEQVIPDTEQEKWKLLNNWYANTSQENRDDVSDNWRKAVSAGAPIHTERHISRLIDELRQVRKEIIDACVSKDSEGRYVLLAEGYKFVEPLYSDISNGAITVEYEENGKDHKYRKLTDGGFGMSSDVVELSKQLEKDEVKIGVGQGESVDDKEYAYTIVHVDRSKTGSWDPHIAKGYAGKLYCFKKASNGNVVAVMLPESRFKQEYDEQARLKLGEEYDPGYEVTPDMVDEAIDENGNIIEGKVPTMAELIFRLLTRSFNISQFGKNVDERLYDELLNLIVHNGEDTGVDTDYKGQDHYNRKLLWFDERRQLHIALPNTATGKWSITKIPRSYFFEENARSTTSPEWNRKRVIAAIATNMHWNTDRDSMTEDMYTEYTALFNYLKKQFKQDPSKKEFSIFGIKDLTFNRDELFDENFKPRRFSHLAWMFTNGKIKTDAISTVFKDPFVFSRGVKPVLDSEQARYKAEVAKRNVSILESKNNKKDELKADKPKTPKKDKKVDRDEVELEDKNTSLFTVALDNIINRVKKYSGLPSNKLKKHLEQMFGMAKDEARKMLDEAGFEDAAILDVPVSYSQSDHISDEDLKSGMDAAIARYVESYNTSHDQKIKVEDFKYDIREGANQAPIWKSQDLPIIGVKKDGSKVIAFVPATAIMNYGKRSTEVGRHPVTLTGAYSTKRGLFGKVNEEAARKFVLDMLGLTDDLIIITNAVLKSFTNKRVYGVTEVAADIINNEARVQFILSKNANKGVYFHEAFHYVNLLLHTKEQRQNIYNTYRREHFLRKNWSDKKIEEELAERCRRYCQMRTERGLLPSIKRMFSNFLDFAFQYRKTSLMRTIYDAMLAGKYKGVQMDEESLKEFEQEYNNKAFMYVPNLRKDVADNFKAIKTEWEFYECAESLALCYTHFVLNTTIESTMAGVNDSFDRFLKDLDLRTSFDRSPYVQDILDNPVAFKYVILGVLLKYGIKGKTKSLKKYQQLLTAEKASESTEQREAEDRYENTWDIDHFELSVKDNVAYRAKLFLSLIPNKRTEDGEFVSVIDDLLGLETYIPFDEVYDSVLKELSNCSTFEQIKRECARLGRTSDLFKSLSEQLEFISGDIQLERQLAATIKKLTPQIAFGLLSEKKQKSWAKDKSLDSQMDTSSASMDDTTDTKKAKVLNDRDKQIDINNDNAIRPLHTALREWSQRAFASNLFMYSKKQKQSYVSDEIESLLELRLKISSALNIKPEKASTDELQNAVEKIKENLLDLLNGLSIPYDKESLDIYIESVIKSMPEDEKSTKDADSIEEYNRNVVVDEFKALQTAFKNKKVSGSLFFILDRLEDAYESDEAELTYKTWSEGRPFDTVFLRYSIDSQISKMAQAYLIAHPSQAEHSVKIPGGRTIYPTNENNAASDRIRWINEDYEGFVEKMLQTPYARHSIMLNLAKELRDSERNKDMLFVLNLFVGMKDEVENKDEDYFGITPMEDTISKMLMINGRYDADSKEFKDGGMFVLPTMADKKTFYGLQLISRSYDSKALLNRFQMPHDILTYDQNSEDGRVQARRFSKSTLDIFVGYFMDELLSLEQYYNRENIKAVVEDPNRLKVNFHGNVSNGRMDFSGNGGLFRYFYDLALQRDEAGNIYNLNLALEAAYLRLKNAEDPYFGEGVWWLREGDNELDGFELVRRKLLEIKDLYFDGEDATDRLYDDINDMLFRTVDRNMQQYAESSDEKLLSAVTTEMAGKGTKLVYVPRAIPRLLLSQYQKAFKDAGLSIGSYNPYRCDTNGYVGDLSLSVIGNYVVGQIISIIEVEKLMSGDPATYKYKYHKAKTPIIIDGQLTESSILKEKDTDKIKRLGMCLSPGQEMDFTEIDYEKHPELKSKNYTVANIKDVQAKSIYLNEMRSIIGSLILADAVRKDPKIVFGELTVTKEQKQEYIDKLYEDYDFYQLELQKLPQKVKSNILSEIEKGIAPYNNITVADAEVLIRPALYRKIRIGLGDWNIDHKIPIKYRDENGKVQTTYYTDDIAYHIVEQDGSWLSDPEKAAIVRNLELYPLKMSYSQNDPHEISLNNIVALDIYDKMAIFPTFKFMFRSKTGQLLYDRMNMENNELDMIAFESAVKVGCDKNMWSPYKKGTESLASMNDIMSMKSSNYIDKDGAVHHNNFDKNVMPVTIQSLDNLRMQLNTEHHEDTERSLGTQMFKILFSNIYDDENYCIDTEKERSGKQIREEIMSCVNALTIQGLKNIKNLFYVKNGTSVDKEKVRNWVKRVLESNLVGANAEEVINNGGSVASLLLRKLIEQSMSALTNSEIVDILTNGGSAVQQSLFGFVSYDADTLRLYQDKVEGYNTLNGGVDLKWLREDGTMEVMLSANFFRSVVPKKFLKTHDMMRQWLIDHDIIKGTKKIIDEKKVHLIELLNTDISNVALSVRATTLLQSLNFTTLKDVVLNEDKIKKAAMKRGDRTSMKEIRDFLESVELTFGMEIPTDVYSYVENNPKPFGMGYRIPTQGLSSTFAFVVADIIPEVAGDVIVVPKEFTAQTGSDFDVDKIFISTFSYDKNGERYTTDLTGDALVNAKSGAIRNKLLLNYIDIATDKKSLANARASIDVITDIIKDEILPMIRPDYYQYPPSFYELTPYFQSLRKKEFSTGKDGIGPFALNITNLALTLFSHLTFNYDADNNTTGFRFKDLDEVTGDDGRRISDWLSAMVNAHVDVAKDPYIFDLNVNKATYNHVNFLLRAGKGKMTFLFIAQNALKEYATRVNSAGGMYGGRIDSQNTIKAKWLILEDLILEYTNKLKNKFDNTEFESDEKKLQWEDIIKKTIDQEVEWHTIFEEKETPIKTSKGVYKSNAEYSLKNPNSLRGLLFLLLCLLAYKQMSPYAESLANLVRVSKIDTKKFGNDVVKHINFLNSLNNFMYGEDADMWTLSPRADLKAILANDKDGGKIYYSSTKYNRNAVEKDKDSLYIFTDNASRTSGSKKIDPESRYSKKYGKGKKYPADTSATIRGLDNAMPVTTVKIFDTKLEIEEKRWHNSDFEEFKEIVDDEFDSIIEEWKTGKYKRIILPSKDGFFNSDISDIREFGDRSEMYSYLHDKMDLLLEAVGHQGKINSANGKNIALNHYFDSSFLSTKLFAATGIMKELLSETTYSATDAFELLFTTFMADIFGDRRFEIGDKMIDGYKDVFNDDIITAIGTATENIMRTLMLFEYGNNIIFNDGVNRQDPLFDWAENEKKNNYTGEIDFTFGGDVEEARRQIKRLFFGKNKSEDPYERKSVFANINDLIRDIKKNPLAEEYSGLTDGEGKIYGILDYLRPVPKTDSFQMERMTFKKSRINTTVDERQKLSSSFGLLLNHPNARVRRVARDIALFAYYSTYDTNIGSSFFDLVPFDFRKQYDAALAEGLKNQNLLMDQLDPTSMLAIICRNYYYDHNIVPVYHLSIDNKNVYPEQREKKTGRQKRGEYKADYITDEDNNARVTPLVITRQTNAKFITIRLDGIDYLYEKTNAIEIYSKSSGLVRDTWNTYVLIPKLGRHYRNIHQYEFLSYGNIHSVFDENNLPEDFDYEDVQYAIQDFMETTNDILSRQSHNNKAIRIRSTKNTVISSNLLVNDLYKRMDRNVKIDDSSIIKSDKKASDFSDFDIDLSKSTEDILQEVQAENSDKNTISISLSGSPQVTVTKEMVDKFIEEQMQLYLSRLNISLPIKMRNEALSKYKEKVKDVAENMVKKRLYEDRTINILHALYEAGVTVSDVYLNFDDTLKSVYKALIKYYTNNFSDEVDHVHVVDNNVSQEDLTDAASDEQLVLSEDENAEALALKQFIDDSNDAAQLIIEDAQRKKDDEQSEIENAIKNDDSDDDLMQSDDPALDNMSIDDILNSAEQFNNNKEAKACTKGGN